MSIKMIAIDIDGTLLNSQHQLTDKVKHTLQQKSAEGVKIVLATGRPTIGTHHVVQQLGFNTDDNFIISYNGSLVSSAGSQKTYVKHGLTYDDFLEIEVLSRAIGVHLHFQDQQTMYTCNRDISPYTVHEAFLTRIPLVYRTVEEITPETDIIKAMFIDHQDVLDAAAKKIPTAFKEKFTTVKSAPFFLEVLNPLASKGNAIRELAGKLNIQPSEIMSLGDNENDLSMIEFAGIGVAMGNGLDSVKEIADKITLSNDEDGVAYAIDKWA